MGTGCSSKSGDVLISDTSEIPCFKIVLVGDPEVGKSSIFLRYFKHQFSSSYRPTTTVTIENVVKKLNIPEHTITSISLWDLPGREEIDLRHSYYRDVDAAIVVVDISDPESVDLAGTWRQDILNHAVVSTKQVEQTSEGPRIVTEYQKADSAGIPVLLLGNKFDIVEEKLAKLNATEDEEPEVNDDIKGNSDDMEVSQPAENGLDVDDVIRTKESVDPSSTGSPQSGGDISGGGDSGEGLSEDGGVWKYEEEQVREQKPAEVQHLEACSEQHSFVGSVAVSAKDPSGGVHIAIQALVRHLLEHRLRHRALQKMAAVQIRRSKRERQGAPKVRPTDAFRPLEVVRVPELDKEFAKFSPPLTLIHGGSLAYVRALRHFKLLCIQLGFVDGPKCSVEDCIEGIKQALEGDELELVTQDCDGFMELAVKGGERGEGEKNEEIKELLTAFNTEVSVASSVIISEFPGVKETLEEMNQRIIERRPGLIEEYVQSRGPVLPAEQQRITQTTGGNLARIKHATIQCSERIWDVETLREKIDAAMIW